MARGRKTTLFPERIKVFIKQMHLKEKGTIEETRMLHADQAQRYTGMGRTAFRKWADSIGATRKFGGSVRFDKVVIDKALDQLANEGKEL